MYNGPSGPSTLLTKVISSAHVAVAVNIAPMAKQIILLAFIFLLIIGHAHLLQEWLPARIFVEVDKERVDLGALQSRVPLLARPLQPFKRLIFLTAISVDLG